MDIWDMLNAYWENISILWYYYLYVIAALWVIKWLIFDIFLIRFRG